MNTVPTPLHQRIVVDVDVAARRLSGLAIEAQCDGGSCQQGSLHLVLKQRICADAVQQCRHSVSATMGVCNM